MDTTMSFSDPFTWLFMLTMMFAMGLFLSKGVSKLFFAMVMVVLNGVMMHDTLQQQMDKAFVFERFSAGDPIECGLWRGSRMIADPSKGWTLNKDRFIKDDQVLSDASLCSVVNKTPPKAPWFESVFTMIVIVLVMVLGRFGLYEQYGMNFWSGEKKKRSDEDSTVSSETELTESAANSEEKNNERI